MINKVTFNFTNDGTPIYEESMRFYKEENAPTAWIKCLLTNNGNDANNFSKWVAILKSKRVCVTWNTCNGKYTKIKLYTP